MKNIFTAFKEHKDFQKNIPWTVIESRFEEDSSVALHYADTIEILLIDGAEGEVRIGGHRYGLSGKQVFFIPPETVHSMNYKKSGGRMKNIKLSLEGFSEFINIEAIFIAAGKKLADISFCPPCYGEIEKYAGQLKKTEDICRALCAVIGIFSVLMKYCDGSGDISKGEKTALENGELKEIIKWTNIHYPEKILIENVAEKMGYSKFYFCSKFRAATGITYHAYLNGVRISKACVLLKNNFSVAQAAEKCGFCDSSYFISAFKKIKGITPKQYINFIK